MEGDDENLQQPKIEVLKGTNKLLFTWVNEYLQGQRNIYAKIYVPGEAWSNTKAVLLYKDVYGGDMGNPTSIELENGKIMTVFYDKGAGFVGAVFNEVDELRVLRSQSELNSKSEQSLEVFHEDFDGKTSGDTYLNQDNNLLWMDKEGTSTSVIDKTDGNAYTKVTFGDSSRSYINWWFNNISPEATMTFDFRMPNTLTTNWHQIKLSFGTGDGKANIILHNDSKGQRIRFCNNAGETYPMYYNGQSHTKDTDFYDLFTAGEQAPWYSVKIVWEGYRIYMKLWEKGTVEPEDYTFTAQNAQWNKESKIFMTCTGNTGADTSVYLDNIVISKKTEMSIVSKSENQLAVKFERDISYELPVPKVVWSSSDPKVVTIDATGKMNYVGTGTATITATCNNLTATKDVTVEGWQVYHLDFESDKEGNWNASDIYDMSFTDYDKPVATQEVIKEDGNQYLSLKHTSRSTSEFHFPVSTDSTLSFDFKMPITLSSGWSQINIGVGNTGFNPQWQFMQSSGSKFARLYDSSEKYRENDIFQTGDEAPWYSVSITWNGNVTHIQMWEKGKSETMLYDKTVTHDGFAKNSEIQLKFATNEVVNTVYLDNISITKNAKFSIVDDGSNKLQYSFGYDISQLVPTPNVTWKSSDESVLCVDKDGNLTCKGIGKATITATCDNLTSEKEFEVCELKFDMQGHGNSIEKQYVVKGHQADIPEAPNAEVYKFDGWYVQSVCRERYDFSQPVTNSMTLYAKWKYQHNIYDMDFENAEIGEYLVQDGNGLWMDAGTTTIQVQKDNVTDNQYLSISGGSGAWNNFWFNNMTSESTIAFDFCMPSSSEGWDRLAIAVGKRDDDMTNAWRFEQWQGAASVKYVDASGKEQTDSGAFEIGSWYSVKMDWDSEWISVKLWKKGTTEPEQYTYVVKNENYIKESKVSFNYYTTGAGSTIYLDNIRFYKVGNASGGDVNGDGIVDVKDLIRLKKHICGVEHAWGGNCDVDNCGTVDSIDLDVLRDTYLLKKGTDSSLKNTLNGKYVSVLGDSISTFAGVSDVAGNNTTTAGYTPEYDGSKGNVSKQNQTYWGKTIETYNMKLLVNNSCGANKLTVSGTSYLPNVSAGYLRAAELSANTGNLDGTKPDVIWMHMGTNDYIGNITLGEYPTEVLVTAEPKTFTEAYIITIEKMLELYPNAKIFCFTLMPSNWNTDWTVLDSYNARIREIATQYKEVTLVDVAKKITTDNYHVYTYDNTHPNAMGMTVIARELECALEKAYK